MFRLLRKKQWMMCEEDKERKKDKHLYQRVF